MKSLVYEGPEKLRYRDAEETAPVEGESLVRIAASGICGSDMHAYFGHDSRRVPPLILGHEAAGEALTGPHAGKRVALNPLITCGSCDYCLRGLSNLCPHRTMHGMNRPGFYAETVATPDRSLIPLPEGMPLTHAALTEPTGCVVRALDIAKRVLNRPREDCRILVLGAGAIGLLASLLVEHSGSRELVTADTNELRRDCARAALAGDVINPLDMAFDGAFDLVIDAVGSAASRQTAVASVAPGGAVVHIGLHDGADGLDARALTLKEIAFMGVYAYTHDNLLSALDLLSAGALGGLGWVDQRSLSEGVEAFRALAAGEVAAAKIVLRV